MRRICCKETDRASQARIDELSMHQERNPTTMSQLLTQILDLQNKVNSFPDTRELYDPETASSSDVSHVLCQRLADPSPRTMPCRDSGLPHDTRNIMGTPENVFERLPAREGPPSALFENSKNLASSSRRLTPDISGNTTVPEREMRREPQNGTYSHDGLMECTRYLFSEMHPGKFPDSMEFQSRKVNFKTEVCSETADPHLTMHWIKEVERAKSIDEHMTSRSIVGRRDFADHDMLDAKIASAWKKPGKE